MNVKDNKLTAFGNFIDKNGTDKIEPSDKGNEPKLYVIVHRIINLLFLLPSPDEKRFEKQPTGDEDNKLYSSNNILDNEHTKQEKVLTEDMFSQTVKDFAEQDGLEIVSVNKDVKTEIKTETSEKNGHKKNDLTEEITLSDDASKVREPNDQKKDNSLGITKLDKSTSTYDLEKLIREEAEKQSTDVEEEYNSKLFGLSLAYDFDSWDFSIPNRLACPKNGDGLYLLVIIHSHVPNFEQRQAIRDSWGRLAKMEGISYTFVVGNPTDYKLDDRLIQESDTNKDITVTDLADLELNDAAISVMMFKWLMYYCPKVRYVMKTEDNVFVNLPQVSIFLQDEKIKDDRMYGFLYEGFKPERDPKKVNYVTRMEFKEDVFPNYLASEGYIFPGKMASLLFRTALKTKYIPIENVFVTGILAEKLKIPREDVPLFSSTFPDLPKTEQCHIFSYTLVFHPLSPQGLRYFWNELKKTGFSCGKFLESAGRMMSKDERMYSDNNKKLLYALLAGESTETTENNKNNDVKLITSINGNGDSKTVKKSDPLIGVDTEVAENKKEQELIATGGEESVGSREKKEYINLKNPSTSVGEKNPDHSEIIKNDNEKDLQKLVVPEMQQKIRLK